MTDLWTEASIDTEQATLDRHLTAARVASAPVWPFLAQATSPGEYANRKALVADRVDRIAAAVADGDPALFGVVRASLDDGFDADFAVLHADRVATAKIEAEKTAAQQATEAQIRAQAERETLEQVLAALVWDSRTASKSAAARKTAAGYGGGSPKSGDTATCHKDGGAIQFFDGQWMHLKGTGDSHNDVYPATPKEQADKDAKTSRLEVTAGHEIYVTKKPPCDVCRQQGQDTPAEYDSRLPGLGGSWGNVCQRHFDAHGPGGTGTGHAQRYVQREAATTASKTAGKSLTNIGKTSDPNVFAGTDNQGQRVYFKVSDKEAADLKAVLYSDLAMNFSGVEVDPQDVVMNPDLGKGASLSPEVAEELQRRATVQGSLEKQAEFPPKKDGNPFGGGHDNPAAPKPDDAQQGGSWKCPACGSSNAFTQGGIELADALKQHQPIQCGDCKQIDQTGGQQQDPNAQQQPGQPPHQQTSQPQVPPPHHGAKTAAGDNPYAGDANPYTQRGVPDDQMDGPQPVPVADAAPPESTRPRVMPSDPTPPPVAPVPAAPAAPAGPADPAGGGDTPPPKKAAGLGFHSASFVKD